MPRLPEERKPGHPLYSRASKGRPARLRNQGFLFILRWLPKLDLISIWILDPRKVPVAGIFLGLFDGHALTLKMAEHFFHALHSIIDLTGSRLIFDVLIRR